MLRIPNKCLITQKTQKFLHLSNPLDTPDINTILLIYIYI